MGKQQEPVRIAHIIGKLNAAGVEAVINNYYRNIDHSRFQFDYFIEADSKLEPPQELIDLGARYFVVPPYTHLKGYMSALEKQFAENKYQIVHSSMNTLTPFSLYAAWKAGVPARISHNHSTAYPGEVKKTVLKDMLKPFARCFATDLCACSRKASEWLFGKKATADGTVLILKNAVDL